MNFLISKEETAELAGGYLSRIALIIRQAFQDYLDIVDNQASRGRRANFHARTMASIIHDQIQARAGEEFKTDTNIKVGEFNGIFGLLISSKIFIRFKKLNADMKASNIVTDQVDSFIKQDLEIPGFGKPTLLTAGYVPEATWTAIKSIFLTCQREDEVLWYKDLHTEVTQVSMFASVDRVDGNEATDDEPLVKIKSRLNADQTGTSN